MPGSFTLGRVAGVAVNVHSSWLIAFVLVAWSLAAGYYPSLRPRFDPLTYWVMGVASALLLFASVLVHELSHSLVALARGMSVQGITLFIFGGVSTLRGESRSPKDEFLISVVGPLTSLVLAGVFWGAARLVPGTTPVGMVLGHLAFTNLLLAIFNLLPGFPLDGGRVLRSIVWATTNSHRTATRVASFVGQAFGFLLILWGVSQMLSGEFLNGLWTAFIGWFLSNAAESARHEQATTESLRGVRVADLMNPSPPITAPTLSVQDFVFEHVLRRGERALLVVEDGRLLGIVSITDVKKVPPEQWPTTSVGRVMTPAPLKTVSPEVELSEALQMLVSDSLNQVPVVRNGALVGELNRTDALRFLQLRDELHFPVRRAADAAEVRPPAA